MKLQLGAIVQNPETGEFYDDGTGSNLATEPPGSTDIPGTLPSGSAQPSGWLDSITKALPGVSAFLTAEQLAQVNIKRAKAGQPPLQTSQYAPQVGVGLDQQTKSFITIGGLALAGFLILPKLLGKKRR